MRKGLYEAGKREGERHARCCTTSNLLSGVIEQEAGFTATSVRHSPTAYYHHGIFFSLLQYGSLPCIRINLSRPSGCLPASGSGSAGRDALSNMAVCWVVVPTSS